MFFNSVLLWNIFLEEVDVLCDGIKLWLLRKLLLFGVGEGVGYC